MLRYSTNPSTQVEGCTLMLQFWRLSSPWLKDEKFKFNKINFRKEIIQNLKSSIGVFKSYISSQIIGEFIKNWSKLRPHADVLIGRTMSGAKADQALKPELHGLKDLVMPRFQTILAASVFATASLIAEEKPQSLEPAPTNSALKAEPTVSDVLKTFSAKRQTASPEDIDSILKNEDKYVAILVKAIKAANQELLDGEATPAGNLVENSIWLLAGRIKSPDFQQALLDLGKTLKSDYKEFINRRLAASVPLKAEIFQHYLDVSRLGNFQEVVASFGNIKDPQYHPKAIEELQYIVDKLGDSASLERAYACAAKVGLMKSGAAEYVVETCKKYPGNANGIVGECPKELLDTEPLKNYLIEILKTDQAWTGIINLGDIDETKVSQALFEIPVESPFKIASLEVLLKHKNSSAIELLKGINLDVNRFAPEAQAERFLLEHPELFTKASSANAAKRALGKFAANSDNSALGDFFKIIGRLDSDLKTELLGVFKKEYVLNPKIQTICDAVSLQITRIDAFEGDTINTLIEARKNPVQTDKQILVITQKVKDLAFEKLPEIDDLVKHGFQVFYYESNSDLEAAQIISECKANNVRADAVILWGHGTRTGIAQGGIDQAVEEIPLEQRVKYLDNGDMMLLLSSGLTEIMKPKCQLIAGGCNNNQDPDPNSPNLVETLQNNFPEAIVSGASVPYVRMEFSYDINDRIKGVRFKTEKELIEEQK